MLRLKSSLRKDFRKIFVQLSRTTSTISQQYVDQTQLKPFEAIPGPKGIYQWPIIGTILNFQPFTKYYTENVQELLFELSEKYGPVFKCRIGPQTVVISDPKDFLTVLRNEGKYPKRPTFDIMSVYNRRNGLQEGVLQLQGKEWHALRTILNKRLLKVDSATHYLDQLNEVANDLVYNIEQKNPSPDEFENLMFRYTSESSGVVTFNKRMGLLDKNSNKDNSEFARATQTYNDIFMKYLTGQLVLYKWYGNPSYKRFESASSLINRISTMHVANAKEILDQRMKSGQFNDDEPNLLFSLLSEKSIPEETVVSLVSALYPVGINAVAKYIPVFLYHLATNLEKQEILRQEIVKNIGTEGPVTAESLSKMTYLKAALKESFRLKNPSVSGVPRVLLDDVILGQYIVPAGTRIMMFNPRPGKTHFENPDQYLPERWLRSENDNHKDAAASCIVAPFGLGPRNCVGRRFALQQMHLAAAKILQRFNIEFEAENQAVKFNYRIFVVPEKPIKFKFTKINH